MDRPKPYFTILTVFPKASIPGSTSLPTAHEEGKLAVVYSWHDLRHAFARRHASRGLVWLRDRLGHSNISVTERYLRNVLGVDTGRM